MASPDETLDAERHRRIFRCSSHPRKCELVSPFSVENFRQTGFSTALRTYPNRPEILQ
jgi:hypothetical protein